MAVTVQMQFESAVTEMYQDAFVGSAIDNGTTIIMFDLRKHDFHQEWGTQATLYWCKEASYVNGHELSTFHNPIQYRCILAQGAYLDGQHQRVYFTPAIKGISTSQPMSHSVIWLACYLAVVCGVSLRHMALLFAALFLIPMTKSSIKRWIDDIGSHLPTPEEMLRPLLVLAPVTECHIDGYYPYSQNIRTGLPTVGYTSTITRALACLLLHSPPYSVSIQTAKVEGGGDGLETLIGVYHGDGRSRTPGAQ